MPRAESSESKKRADGASREAGGGRARARGARKNGGRKRKTRSLIPGSNGIAPARRSERPSARPKSAVEAQIRFRLASLLRLSDNIMRRMVGAYDTIFELDTQDKASIFLQMSQELAHEGKVDEALEALRGAAELHPDDPTPWIRIGEMYLQRKAPEAALQALKKARALGDESAALHLSIADALVMQDKHVAAAAELELAADKAPDSAETMYRLGTVVDHLGRFDEAVEALARAVELDPEEVTYHQSLGFALESAGRRQDAIQCFKRALELERRRKASSEA